MNDNKEVLTPEQLSERDDDFQYWLMDMPDALERFKDEMPIELQDELDFSLKSLDIVERHLLNSYRTIEQIMSEPSYVADGYAVYLGQTFRKVLNNIQPNRWRLMLDSDNVFYLLPVIEIGYFITCPLSLVTACIDRKKGNYWSWILRNQLHNMKK